jgi:L-2-hydroxyglutarate oxidase
MGLFPGFWRMTAHHWKTGWLELYRSLNKQAFVRQVQRLVPAIQPDDLVPAGSGVRAQAVDQKGALLDDFHLIEEDHTLHVVNAPSPAATASLAIGEFIARAAQKQLGLGSG